MTAIPPTAKPSSPGPLPRSRRGVSPPPSGPPMTSLPPSATRTQDPDTMPAHVHSEKVVSAFRHLPLYGQLPDTYTVITRDSGNPPSEPRYSVSRARFAPLLGRWSIDTDYDVSSGLTWTRAAEIFTRRVTNRVS